MGGFAILCGHLSQRTRVFVENVFHAKLRFAVDNSLPM
jgi:hypothetical protein